MVMPTPIFGRKYQHGVNWITAIAMAGFHVGAVAALFYVDAGAIATDLGEYQEAAVVGPARIAFPAARH